MSMATSVVETVPELMCIGCGRETSAMSTYLNGHGPYCPVCVSKLNENKRLNSWTCFCRAKNPANLDECF